MVVATLNLWEAVPSIKGVFGADGVHLSGVTNSTTQLNTATNNVLTYVGPSVTLLANETIWYKRKFSANHVAGTWAPSAQTELYNTVTGLLIPNTIRLISGSNTYNTETLIYKNTSGVTQILRSKIRGWTDYQSTGYLDNTCSFHLIRYIIMSASDIEKWEIITSSHNRHVKAYIENIYLFCPNDSTSITVHGKTQSNVSEAHTANFQDIIVIPVNSLVSQIDISLSGTVYFAVTGKGFNVSN